MPVATSLGLADHGHPVTLGEFESAEFEEGYKYELIDGRLYVSPAPICRKTAMLLGCSRSCLNTSFAIPKPFAI